MKKIIYFKNMQGVFKQPFTAFFSKGYRTGAPSCLSAEDWKKVKTIRAGKIVIEDSKIQKITTTRTILDYLKVLT
ncbi:MAG: hypothetical protein RR313_00200 [Anaerovoracaceae bacterium]